MKISGKAILLAACIAIHQPAKAGEMTVIENETLYHTVINPLKDDGKNTFKYAPILLSNYPENSHNRKYSEPTTPIQTFLDRYNKERIENPNYYVINNYEEGELPYEEGAWSALGHTLKSYIPFVQTVEDEIYRIREHVTVEYKDHGLSLKLRPYIQGIADKEYGLNLIGKSDKISIRTKFNLRKQRFSISNSGTGVRVGFSIGYDSDSNDTAAFLTLAHRRHE
jgi:hypothetical protein